MVVIAGLAAYRVFGLTASRHFDTDEFEHIQAAWLMSTGLVIYRDFFEHHPPLLYLLLAPLLQAPDAVDRLVDARMVMVPFALAIVWLVGAIAARLGNILSGALAAALVSTVVIFQQKSIEVRPDVPAIAFLLLAILGCVAPRLSARRLAAVGFALGIALLLTPKIVFATPAVAIAAWWPGEGLSRARASAALAAGLLLPVVAVGTYLLLQHALTQAFYYNVTFNLAVPFGLRWKSLNGSLVGSFQENWAFWALAVCAIVVWVVGVLQNHGTGASKRQTAVVLAATLGLAVGLVSIQVPLRQYVAALAVMLSIAAGVFGSRVIDTVLRSTSRMRKAAVLVVLAMILLQPARSLFVEEKFTFKDQITDLRYIWSLTPSDDDRVFDCWTGLGVFRRPVFFYQFLGVDIVGALNSLQPQWGEELTQSLRARRPAVIIRDPMLGALPRSVIEFIRSEYQPDQNGLSFVRK